MSALSFDSFTKKIYIKAPIEKLYSAWGTTSGICSWFLRNAVYLSPQGRQRKADEYIQAGDQYIWEWHNWNGQEKGEVLQIHYQRDIEANLSREGWKVGFDANLKDQSKYKNQIEWLNQNTPNVSENDKLLLIKNNDELILELNGKVLARKKDKLLVEIA